jgi:hypothetical protein
MVLVIAALMHPLPATIFNAPFGRFAMFEIWVAHARKHGRHLFFPLVSMFSACSAATNAFTAFPSSLVVLAHCSVTDRITT